MYACCGVVRCRANRIRFWPPGRDERSGVLIGAGGTRHFDWPRAREKQSMAHVQGAIDSLRTGASDSSQSATTTTVIYKSQ